MTLLSPDHTAAATEESIQRAAGALAENNIEVVVVDDGAAARQRVLGMIPDGAEVYTAKSKTLEDIGIFAAINESGNYDAIRPRYLKMDRATQAREIRKLMAAPDYIVGSVQALTEDGQLVATSYSGSQVGGFAFGGGRVILVVGSQKIVPDLATGLARMREHVLPYEDARLREQLGIGTKAAKILIHSAEGAPGRTTVIIVRSPVGV
jgi:LUD domain